MTALSPSIYTLPQTPLHSDGHQSATLQEQSETEHLISELLALTAPPAPHALSSSSSSSSASARAPTETKGQGSVLRKGDHIKYACSTMNHLPAPYVSLDASRPWLMFWTMHSLDLLGCGLDNEVKNRAVSTLLHFLSPLGGFAGGPANTQLPHLLPTYASTCSLAIVGNSGAGGGWEELASARQGVYDFFMSCKQPDGGFVVSQGGEVDVRGTYCLLVVATLLDLITPELVHNVDKFIAGCQTYEGGFACASFPFGNGDFRAAQAEAHGGYTSCSINSHFLLSSIRPPTPLSKSGTQPQGQGDKSQEVGSSLDNTFPEAVDVDAALRWSVMQQGEAIEGGGFRGRSNKLVDGCYSWWVGGGIPVLEALQQKQNNKERTEDNETAPPVFNHVALQEFVIIAAQKESGGGLRDKPGKRPDLYHTCNNLSGLSIAQHQMTHSKSKVIANRAIFDPTKGFPAIVPKTPGGGWRSEEERQSVRREVWSNALGWIEGGPEYILGGKESRLNTTTPVFNILGLRLKPFINYFYGQS